MLVYQRQHKAAHAHCQVTCEPFNRQKLQVTPVPAALLSLPGLASMSVICLASTGVSEWRQGLWLVSLSLLSRLSQISCAETHTDPS